MTIHDHLKKLTAHVRETEKSSNEALKFHIRYIDPIQKYFGGDEAVKNITLHEKMSNLRTEKFDIEYFQEYVKTYKERHPDNQNIMFQDMLYGIGLAVDKEKFEGHDGFRKFIKWISECQKLDEFDKIMKEIYDDEMREAKMISDHNYEIYNELRKTLDDSYIETIVECLKDAESDGKLEIVDDPGFDRQYEDWGSFDHVIVDQYVNGGHTGDSYAGDIYIPIGGGKYLKSFYSM